MNAWAIICATLLGFAASFVYYVIFARQQAKLSPRADDPKKPSAWKLASELLRNLVLAIVLSYLISHLTLSPGGAGAFVGLPLWVAFPVSLLVGSIMYEKVPLRLATIHAGDWFIKLLLMCAVIGNWR